MKNFQATSPFAHQTADSDNALAETHNWSSGYGGTFRTRRHADLQPGTRQTTTIAQPSPTPEKTDQSEVFTEEVRLPVVAFDAYGHYDPTLELDDVLVLEDGVASSSAASDTFLLMFCSCSTLAAN